ncbi:MAG: hypothetical protein JST81_14535 [Bacteroidetes bacterium]|nr:hypothetical protein [Bacteroidota bacterium]
MTTINLKDLYNVNQQNIYVLLLNAQTQHFEIIIPKTHNPVDDDEFLIFWEYHIIAYAGQQLSDMSTEFTYNIPFPNSTKHFVFEIKTKEFEKLAELLYMIQNCFYNEDHLDSTIDFQFKASQYFNDAFDNKIESATWGLLASANNFLSE